MYFLNLAVQGLTPQKYNAPYSVSHGVPFRDLMSRCDFKNLPREKWRRQVHSGVPCASKFDHSNRRRTSHNKGQIPRTDVYTQTEPLPKI